MESLPAPINNWREKFVAFFSMFFADLARREVTEAAESYLESLLRPLAAKNCWSIAEASGASNPQPHQRLLRTAKWDEQALNQSRRQAVVETLGDPDGVLILMTPAFSNPGTSRPVFTASTAARLARLTTVKSVFFPATPVPKGTPSIVGGCIWQMYGQTTVLDVARLVSPIRSSLPPSPNSPPRCSTRRSTTNCLSVG